MFSNRSTRGAVSISADGNTAIIGGPSDNSEQGAAWIFQRIGNVWSQQGSKLVGIGSIGKANQGISVDISADGNTAIVGGYGDNSGQGAAWIFTRNGNIWTQQGSKLIGTGNIGAARQGVSVSLSADGNTAVIGGSWDNSSIGAFWIFERNNNIWIQKGSKYQCSGYSTTPSFGMSVSISSDGNTIVAGGMTDSNNVGAVWVFSKNSGNWSQMGSKLVGSGGVGTQFQGSSVSINSDGKYLILGGTGDNNYIGASWIFVKQSSGNWIQQGTKLVGNDYSSSSNFFGIGQGISSSISGDGNYAIIGGSTDSNGIGAIWLFKRSVDTWTQVGSKIVGNNCIGAPRQGCSAAISKNGCSIISGGFNDNNQMGSSWVFNLVSGKPIVQFDINKYLGKVSDTFDFIDQTSNFPLQWLWRISPNTYSYLNGYNNLSQNPRVKFNQDGLYTIKLISTNQFGSDSLTKSQIITISSGGSYSITGTVFNPYINFTNNTLISPKQEKCIVQLKQNGDIVSEVITTSTGTFSFTGLNSSQSYDICVKYGTNINDTVRLNYSAVSFGNLNIQLPYNLIAQINKFVDSLEYRKFPISFFYNLINTEVNGNGYNETVIRNLLNSSQQINTNHDKKIELLERLLIAQRILTEYSNDGAKLSAEGVVSTLDLARSLYGLVTMKEKMAKLLMGGVSGVVDDYATKYLEKIVIAGFEVFRDLSKASVESVQDQNLRNSLKVYIDFSFDIVEKAALSSNSDEFSESLVNDFIENQILNFGTPIYYRNLFVGYTQENVTKTVSNFNGPISGSLSNALFQSNIIINSGHAVTQIYLDEITKQRSDANLKWIADQILKVTGNTTQETEINKIVLNSLKELDEYFGPNCTTISVSTVPVISV